MEITAYQPAYQPHFERLNKAWLNKYFEVEPIDEWVLANPEEAILRDGGKLLFALHEGQIIGTVALKVAQPGTIELTKMAVDETFQGFGAGKLLCKAAIDAARELQFERLILYSNRSLERAIGMYRKLGFKEVPVEKDGIYTRCNIKMELALKPEPEKWFDRKFDFRPESDEYKTICKRLEQAAARLRQNVSGIPEEVLLFKPGGRWSVKEHIGHLSLLEPLWRTRFIDIMERRPVLSPADLDNKATFEAGFNKSSIADLLEKFAVERNESLLLLNTMDAADETRTSLHPRLQQSMRIVDLAYFVAEHDDHHISAIQAIIRQKISHK